MRAQVGASRFVIRATHQLGLAYRPVGAWRRHLVKQFTPRRIARDASLMESAGRRQPTPDGF